MPHHLAMEIMLLGSKIPAQRAYDVGFVNRVVPNGEHETEALVMAEDLLGSAPLVISALKRLVNEVMPTGPIERMVTVSQTIAKVRQSEDLQEGIRAYKEKRQPRFHRPVSPWSRGTGIGRSAPYEPSGSSALPALPGPSCLLPPPMKSVAPCATGRFGVADGIVDLAGGLLPLPAGADRFRGLLRENGLAAPNLAARIKEAAAERWPSGLGDVIEFGCGIGLMTEAVVTHELFRGMLVLDSDLAALRTCQMRVAAAVAGPAADRPVYFAAAGGNQNVVRDAGRGTR